MNQAPPTSKLGRSAISGMALAHAGMLRVGHQARQMTRAEDEKAAAQEQHEAQLGRVLFRALNQLKGTALKLSQLLSMEADFLPEGIRRELAKACHQVTPLNRALVHKVFRHEFSCAPEQLFAEFTPTSFAAASLGQVHHAQMHDGLTVAVKIQYPGIASSIGSDIRMLRGILHTLGLGSDLIPRKDLIDRVMNEVEHKLAEELDYQHEAEQLRWFRQHVSLPGIVIPRPIASHSSQRILTMQHLEGMHLDAWLASQPDQAQRDHFGQLLFDWFWHSVGTLRRLHADPHPGNFLFMPDGQLGVIDFGCTRSISASFCKAMAQAWRGLQTPPVGSGFAAVRYAYIELGLIAPELTLSKFEEQLLPAAAALIEWQLEPYGGFCGLGDNGEPRINKHTSITRFDFSHKSPYPAPDRDNGKKLAVLAAGFDTDILYFDRAYMGLMHMLKKIGATVTTTNPWTTSP